MSIALYKVAVFSELPRSCYFIFCLFIITDCQASHRRVMSDRANTMKLEAEMAAPLHLQRLERSMNVQPFLKQINNLFQEQARY